MKQKTFERLLFWGTCVLAVILLISHDYNDILVTTRHGMRLWDALLEGKFFAFYDLNMRVASGNLIYNDPQMCAYNILLYIVFAVWNLPLYLLERLGGMDVMNNIVCLVYSKLLPVVALAVTMAIMKKIMEELEIPEKQHDLLLYLYFSSAMMVGIVFLTGQYDTISLIFQLLGILAYIREDYKRFAIWFGVAFCFKFFAFVIFLPLLLLKEKKILGWIKHIGLMAIPWLITKIPFWVHAVFARSADTAISGGEASAATLMEGMLLSSNVNIHANLFLIAYACILVWCYLQEGDREETVKNGIWASMVAYAAFFGLMNGNPYWPVLLVPFVILVIAMNPEQLYLNLLLETIGMAGLLLTNIVRHPWVFLGKTLRPMIWPYLLEGTGYDALYTDSSIYQLLSFANSKDRPQAVPNSLFLAAIIAMAFLVYSRKNSWKKGKWPEETEYRDMLVVRFGVNAVLWLIPIIAIFL